MKDELHIGQLRSIIVTFGFGASGDGWINTRADIDNFFVILDMKDKPQQPHDQGHYGRKVTVLYKEHIGWQWEQIILDRSAPAKPETTSK